MTCFLEFESGVVVLKIGKLERLFPVSATLEDVHYSVLHI